VEGGQWESGEAYKVKFKSEVTFDFRSIPAKPQAVLGLLDKKLVILLKEEETCLAA
jgi:hypothetical protein